MALKVIDTARLDAIANAINSMTGKTDKLTLDEMITEMENISANSEDLTDVLAEQETMIAELKDVLSQKTGIENKLPLVLSGKVTEITEKDFGDITSLRFYSLYGCSVVNVSMPDTIVTINNNAFTYCSKLTSIKLSNNLKTFGKEVFSGCTNLTSIELPVSLTTLGNYLFNGCSSLNSIAIPNGITEITQYMMYGCTSLKVFDLTSYGQYIPFPLLANVNAFTNTHADMKIVVPKGRKSALAGMTNWSTYADKIVEVETNE